jgi:putative zinc finger protein
LTCGGVRRRLSAHRDGELTGVEHRTVAAHLDECASCGAQWRGLAEALDALADVPRLECSGEVASRVFDRLDMENRKPGLAVLFRIGSARPLILPSLVPAVMVLVTVITVALALDRPEPLPPVVQQRQLEAWTSLPSPVPDWGTERHPLFAYGGVSTPRARSGATVVPSYLLEQTGEGTLFLETVVARDGTVSAVHLIGGDSNEAAPLLEALRKERFEPGRFRGRPVAVSMYRLISRMEVRAPIT